MSDDTPKITVSHADLDAALEADAASKKAAEPPAKEKEPEIKEPEPDKALSSEVDLKDSKPVVEPEKKPEKKEKDPEEEPDEHKERSKLGRRVSGLEQNINTLISKLDELITVQSKVKDEQEDEAEDEPVILTKKELRELIRNEAKHEVKQTKVEDEKAKTKYENAYIGQVRKIGGNLPEKQLEVIFKEMYDHHNEIIYNNPEVDADINFHRAVASLAAKAKPTVKVVPLKKDDPKNLGGPAETTEARKKSAPPKWDEHVAAFAKYHKMTDEQVSEALSGEAPLSLRGKINS